MHNLIEGKCPSPDDDCIKGITFEEPFNREERWKRELPSLSERIESAIESKLKESDSSSEAEECTIYAKHISKFSSEYDFDNDVQIKSFDNVEIEQKHIFLIRDVVDLLSSWNQRSSLVKKESDSSSSSSSTISLMEEIGLLELTNIYTKVANRSSKTPKQQQQPFVIDMHELTAADPSIVLKALCQHLEIPYTSSMLSWASGPHDCDGPWAAWWYKTIHKSTGFQNTTKNPRYKALEYSPLNQSILNSSCPLYQYLYSLTNSYQNRGPPRNGIYGDDDRNANLLVWIGAAGQKGRLVPRHMAMVSPWDSSVQGGDGAWEGLRIYRGKILSLEKHLQRLFNSVKALGFQNVHTRDEVKHAIFSTLAANGMRDGTHIRLTITRGEKYTSSMNPIFNVYGTTLIVLAEWKPLVGGQTTYDNDKGVTLITAAQRRNTPSCCDSKIHHNNMINNILPKIQANLANAADAIMLDLDGFVSETNATNLFMVDHDGILLTPPPDACLPGITRATVLELARRDMATSSSTPIKGVVDYRRLSLAEFHSASEVFTTGTCGELTPVTLIDGRVIGNGTRGPITTHLQKLYSTLPEEPGWATPIPEFE